MTIDKDELLSKLKELLKDEISTISYETWILPLGIDSIKDEHITFTVVSPFQKDFIENKFSSLIFNTLRYITNKEWTFSVIDQSNEETNGEVIADKKSNVSDAELESNHQTLNPKYTFETFVVGNNNRFAHAAALAVGNEPGKSYNPLFLYGGVGLGKTHLMHAIGNRILENNRNSNILYVTSEKFTNQLINSIKDNKTEMFRNIYRNIDVLLIDDIQFIAGKERVQEEFFHTFNTLREEGKQIIISSDKPPRDIEFLEDRWGEAGEIALLLGKKSSLASCFLNICILLYLFFGLFISDSYSSGRYDKTLKLSLFSTSKYWFLYLFSVFLGIDNSDSLILKYLFKLAFLFE